MDGRVALVQIERDEEDGRTIKVLLAEVNLGDDHITITDRPGQPVSSTIRQQAERLIDLIMQEQKETQNDS